MIPKMEIRIWDSSSLVDKTVEQISKKYGVQILKVSRGTNATNPSPKLKIMVADYIRYMGKPKSCLKLLHDSK